MNGPSEHQLCPKRQLRTGRRPRPAAVGLVLLVALLAAGCSRQVSLADVGSSGATVWVRVYATDGEAVAGRLVSLDAGSLVVALRYPLSGDIRVTERAGRRALYSGTERVPGELADVEQGEGGRVAVVHRTFRALEVESATFHESAGERSLSSILSLLAGPTIGAALALLL